jgi:hypothetical protein
VDPAHALWIGGGQGSGKSSIAKALSRRHGLQLYNVDHRTQAHVPRLRRHPFWSMSMDERWVEPDVETMLEWFVETSRERLEIVLEDVAELPDEPAAIVEGPQLFPSLVAPLLGAFDQAVFLVPRPNEQRARLAARGPMTWTSQPELARTKAIERDLRISRRFATEARALGFAVEEVDAPLDAMIERVDALLRPAVERLPRGGDRAAARRIENEALATQVRLYRATGEVRADDWPPLVFACECGACAEELPLTLEEYEARRAAAEPLIAAADTSPSRPPRS